ncbi:MAG: thioredoxin domain-containing protein [Miltoncostaeaceae bacterium]
MSTRSPKKKKGNNNLYYIVGAVVALVVAGALIAVSLAGGDGTDKAVDEATITAIQENTEGIPAEGLVLGDPDAPVTITEYSDVACIHCRTAAIESIPDVVSQLVRTGQAKLEYAPTAFISASSERGALGVLAAAEMDAAWPFAEAIFHIQGSASTDWLSDEDMEGIVEQLGLDVDTWREAYQSADIEQRFIESRDAVTSAGVQSTPTFVVTGPGGTERIEGAVPAATIVQAVEQVSTPS